MVIGLTDAGNVKVHIQNIEETVEKYEKTLPNRKNVYQKKTKAIVNAIDNLSLDYSVMKFILIKAH